MTFDLAVARAVMAARQVERALHDSGPWSVRVCGQSFPAVRWIGPDRVIFRAHIPDVCWLDGNDDGVRFVDLVCGEDVVGSRQVQFEESGEQDFTWLFSLVEREPSVT